MWGEEEAGESPLVSRYCRNQEDEEFPLISLSPWVRLVTLLVYKPGAKQHGSPRAAF